MTIKHKLIKYSSTAALVLLILTPAIFALIPVTKAYAADTVSQSAEKEWRALVAFDAIRSCTRAGIDGTLNKSNYNTAEGFNAGFAKRDARYPVGRLFDGDDGLVDCGEKSDLESLASAVGFTLEQLNDVIWPRQGCSKDDCPLASDNTIENSIIQQIQKQKLAGLDNNAVALSDSGKYWYWNELYSRAVSKNFCGGTFTNDATTYNNHVNSQKSSGDYYKVDDKGSVTKYKYALYGVDNSDEILALGPNFEKGIPLHSEASDFPDTSCKDIAGHLKNKSLAAAYVTLIDKAVADCKEANGDSTACTSQTVGGAAASADDSTIGTCEGGGGSLSWLTCPVISAVGGVLNWMDTQLSRLMEIDRDKFTSNSMYIAWSRFRDIGLAVLVIIMLVMVLGTALGTNMLDAYTVKKVMPRLFAAVIFMVLSWWICIYLIDFFNVLGRGILGLMTAPFGAKAQTLAGLFDPSVGGAALQYGGGLLFIGVAAFSSTVLGILISFLGTALLIMGVAFIVLIARQLFVLVLILLAPVAILGWVFPNGSKIWKTWWESFTKLLIMYPMVMAVLASGRIFSSVIGNLQSSELDGGLLNPMLKLSAYIIPYAFIPFTFKAAGGLFGNLVGMANDRSKGAFDRLKKGRSSNYQKLGTQARTGDLFKGRTIGGHTYGAGMSNIVNTGVAGLATGTKGRFGLSADRRNSVLDTALATEADAASKTAAFVANKENDHILRASASGANHAEAVRNMARIYGREYMDAATETVDMAAIERHVAQAESTIGLGRAQQVAAAKQLVMTNTGYSNLEQMSQTLAAAAGGNENTEMQLAGFANAYTKQVGRSDMAPGFSNLRNLVHAEASGNVSALQYNYARAEALRTQGIGAILGGKASGVRNLLGIDGQGNQLTDSNGQPVMGVLQQRVLNSNQNVVTARQSGNTARIEAAEREHAKVLASTAAALDIAQSVSPETGDMVADTLHNMGGIIDLTDQTGGTTTVSEAFEHLRTNTDPVGLAFGQMRREMRQQGLTAAQLAQQQMLQPGGVIPQQPGQIPTL